MLPPGTLFLGLCLVPRGLCWGCSKLAHTRGVSHNKVLLCSSGGRKSQITVLQAQAASVMASGEGPSCLFQLLTAPGGPWLVARPSVRPSIRPSIRPSSLCLCVLTILSSVSVPLPCLS